VVSLLPSSIFRVIPSLSRQVRSPTECRSSQTITLHRECRAPKGPSGVPHKTLAPSSVTIALQVTRLSSLMLSGRQPQSARNATIQVLKDDFLHVVYDKIQWPVDLHDVAICHCPY
jgi:hypothetical protein